MARSGAVNENLATGELEVKAESLRILSEAETPPFPIEEDSKTREELRLKYRYLDLRRPDIQRNLIMRSIIQEIKMPETRIRPAHPIIRLRNSPEPTIIRAIIKLR